MTSARWREVGERTELILPAKRGGAEEVVRGESARAAAQPSPPATIAHINVVEKKCFVFLLQFASNNRAFPAIFKLVGQTDDMLETDRPKALRSHPGHSFISAIEAEIRKFHQVNLTTVSKLDRQFTGKQFLRTRVHLVESFEHAESRHVKQTKGSELNDSL